MKQNCLSGQAFVIAHDRMDGWMVGICNIKTIREFYLRNMRPANAV